ncbi:hypothetical protein [Terriglobus sp.]
MPLELESSQNCEQYFFPSVQVQVQPSWAHFFCSFAMIVSSGGIAVVKS